MAITEPCCPNSLTKFLLDVFADRSTSGLFYTTDMMVLIDIVTRQLSDLGPGEEVSKVEGGGKEMEEGEGSRLLVWNVFREVLSPFSPCPPHSLFPLSPLPLSRPLSPSCLLFPPLTSFPQTRTHYLELLYRIVNSTDYRDHKHHQKDISTCLNRIAQEETPESERDHEVIRKLWVTFPGIFEEVTDL